MTNSFTQITSIIRKKYNQKNTKWRKQIDKQMKWEDVYKLWQRGSYHFPKGLTAPVSAETVFVEYKQDGYIYGYDWLETAEAQKRVRLIQKNPIQFLYFTKPTNKGTIQTAEMLIEAHGEEELAAIWIAATAKELNEYRIRGV